MRSNAEQKHQHAGVQVERLPATLTPLHFARLTIARNAQVSKESEEDAAISTRRLSRTKGADEQDDSTRIDELSTLCNHDVSRMLRALRGVSAAPRASWDWLGTEPHRRRAARRLAQQQAHAQLADEIAAAPSAANTLEHDRVSDSGCATALTDQHTPKLPLPQASGDKLSVEEPAKVSVAQGKSKQTYDPHEHIRKLESKVLEQRKKAERERTEKKLREAQAAARRAKACTTLHVHSDFLKSATCNHSSYTGSSMHHEGSHTIPVCCHNHSRNQCHVMCRSNRCGKQHIKFKRRHVWPRFKHYRKNSLP
jgi:hypothetical protein